MDDQQFDDLKQFIDSRISQAEDLMKSELNRRLAITDQKIDDGLAGVGEAIEQINARLDNQDKEVDQRLAKLEQQMAT